MAIERSDTQQTTCNISVRRGDDRIQAATASCAIRPGRSMSFSVDLYLDQMDEATAEEIRTAFTAYLAQEIEKAAACGIPVGNP